QCWTGWPCGRPIPRFDDRSWWTTPLAFTGRSKPAAAAAAQPGDRNDEIAHPPARPDPARRHPTRKEPTMSVIYTAPAPGAIVAKSQGEGDAIISKVMWRLIPFIFACYVVSYLDRINV